MTIRSSRKPSVFIFARFHVFICASFLSIAAFGALAHAADVFNADDDAADALSRLAKSPGVKGRVACPVAANGAPDCTAAADKLCQGKGFKEGKSLDVATTRNCSAKALLSGRKPDESECRTETYVTRAVCQ